MDQAHWMLMLLTALLMALLTCFSLFVRADTPLYRGARRVFWTALLLQGSGLLGGVGWGPLSAVTVFWLGIPGYAALAALAVL